MTPPLRVLMADDHPIVLAGMKALVAAESDLDIVGEARDGRTALQLAKDLRPDAAVLDIAMPGMNGLEVAQVLRAEAPEIRVIILTVHEDRAYLRQLLEVGVSAYLLKRSAAEELVRAIKIQAARNGRSAEAEHRLILARALKIGATDFWARADALRATTKPQRADSTKLLREMRDSR